MATKHETVSGVVLDERTELTLGDVCRACSVHVEWIVSLVEEGVLEPHGANQASWRFSAVQLRTVRRISRLQRDLGANLAGAALASELIEEIEALRERLAALDPSHE
jgi:chaperone modulatory protein CbpM